MTAPAPNTTAETPAEESPPLRRNPAPFVLGAAVLLLALYYVVLGLSGVLRASSEVPIQGPQPRTGDYMALQISVQDVDLTNRLIRATVLPIPRGRFEGEKAGEIARPLRIEVSSGGVTTRVVTFPGQSVLDPTALELTLERGDTAFPFDEPFANFQLSVQNDKTGTPVPFRVDMTNSARPWRLSGTRAPEVGNGDRTLAPMVLSGHRDMLTVAIVLFYAATILFTTLMAVVTIGSALLRRDLEFSNVIWLSATLLSFPTLRAAMPGSPPIGTGLDFVLVFPCLALVGTMFVWTGGYMIWRESHLLRRRRLDDQTADGGDAAPGTSPR